MYKYKQVPKEDNNEKNNDATDGEMKEKRPYFRQPIRRRGYKPKPIDFSVRVTGLTVGTRVRDLKSALQERGVQPKGITWRGFKGFAFLHFVKVLTCIASTGFSTIIYLFKEQSG